MNDEHTKDEKKKTVGKPPTIPAELPDPPPPHDAEASGGGDRFSWEALGQQLFQWRDYTPVPLVIMVLLFTEASAMSATVGTLMIILGELIRIYSVAFIGAVSRTRSSSTGPTVVKSGPYAWVRNPLYVANLTISVGFALYSGVGWLVVLTALLAGFQYYAISAYEESVLLQKFGQAFDDYRAQVPAWIPKKMPKPDEMDWNGDYRAAFISERPTLTAIVLLLLALMMVSP